MATATATAEKSPKKIPQEKLWTVRDLLAKAPRIHELRNLETGELRRFEFSDFNSKVSMDKAFACSVVNIEGFEVSDPSGTIIKPQRDTTDSGGNGIVLAVDERIGKLSDFKHEALVRFVQEAGGKANKGSTISEMITFLMAVASGGAAKVTGGPVVETGPTIDEEELLLEEGLNLGDD